MNDEQIERLLHKALRPPAPLGLSERLQADIALPRRSESGPVDRIEMAPFIRRWFPAISFAAIFLSCILAIGVQTLQIGELKRDSETLRASAQNLEQLRLENAEYQKLLAARQELEQLRNDFAEIQQLRAEVTQLRAQAEAMAAIMAQGVQLRVDLGLDHARRPLALGGRIGEGGVLQQTQRRLRGIVAHQPAPANGTKLGLTRWGPS